MESKVGCKVGDNAGHADKRFRVDRIAATRKIVHGAAYVACLYFILQISA